MNIAVTGIGVVSSIGLTFDSWWRSVKEKRRNIKKEKRYGISDETEFQTAVIDESEIRNKITGVNTNHYDKVQLLATAAGEEAWKCADVKSMDYSSDEMGVVLGSTYGYIDSVSRFYIDVLENGPMAVSPMNFTNTVMNAAAGKLSIQYKLSGICSTIATGQCSGLDAIAYSCDTISQKQCKVLMTGASSSLFDALVFGFQASGKLAKENEAGSYIFAPFDKNANGTVLGEGASIFVLEDYESAKKRGATIKAIIKSVKSGFVTSSNGKNKQIEMFSDIIDQVVEEAGIKKESIQLISSGASSNIVKDTIEASAIQKSFENENIDVKISAVKSTVGECLDAGSAFQFALGVGAIQNDCIPPITGLNKPKIETLNYVTENEPEEVMNVLITTLSDAGQCTAAILSREV